jgi:nicotinamidase-related amidase
MNDKDNIRSGFNGSLQWGKKPALLVVDFQRGFTEPAVSPLAAECPEAVLATNEIIRAMRGVGPVIFTVIGYDNNFSDMGCWGQKCTSLNTLKRNTPACELDPRLEYDAATDLILYKTQASAFFGTALAAILSANRCDMVIVAGCTTSGCVRASVVDAMQNGFPPFVARECVADRSQAQHDSNLIDMNSKYAEVVSLEAIVGNLASLRSTNAVQ